MNRHSVSIALLALLTTAMFGDVFLPGRDLLLSRFGTDLDTQFRYWREYGFNQISQGEFPLWNPHSFCGMPFFGNFQTALLYPPNWIHLVLDLDTALNFTIAFHIFLLGGFMYAWAARCGHEPLSAGTAAVITMFGTPAFLHIYAGHISNICAMAWAPAILMAVDELNRKPGRRWVLIGMTAAAMQILAGHPQYVFYTSVAASIFALATVRRSSARASFLLCVMLIYAGAAALTAVQLLAGFDAASESIRSGGVDWEYASVFALPPENMLTLLAPGLFGDHSAVPYWGENYMWEMIFFIGVTGIILAAIGASGRLAETVAAALLLILAFGYHTPVYRVVYDWIPGFDHFRGTSKFMFQASLFLALIAASGMDRIIRGTWRHRMAITATAGLALTVLLTGLAIRISAQAGPDSAWSQWVQHTLDHKGFFMLANLREFQDVRFPLRAGLDSSAGLFTAAGVLALIAALLIVARKRILAVYLIAALAAAEVFLFARTHRPVFETSDADLNAVEAFVREHRGEQRIHLTGDFSNRAMSLGYPDLWGMDPIAPRRYVQLMHVLHSERGSSGTIPILVIRQHHPLHRMLRARDLLEWRNGELRVQILDRTLGVAAVVHEVTVVANEHEVIPELLRDNFDPAVSAVLTDTPAWPFGTADPSDTVHWKIVSGDEKIIEARLRRPGLLLITENFSLGWRADPLPGSVQELYSVVPANYTLQAIPLKAGEHRIRLRYLPKSFVIGTWISIGSLAFFTLAAGLEFRRWAVKRRRAGA